MADPSLEKAGVFVPMLSPPADAGPKHFAGVPVHALNAFGPMVPADDQIRPARPRTVEELIAVLSRPVPGEPGVRVCQRKMSKNYSFSRESGTSKSARPVFQIVAVLHGPGVHAQ